MLSHVWSASHRHSIGALRFSVLPLRPLVVCVPAPLLSVTVSPHQHRHFELSARAQTALLHISIHRVHGPSLTSGARVCRHQCRSSACVRW